MEQSDESGREKPSSVHQNPDNETPKSFGNALPLIDEQIPKNVLDAVSLVLEGLSQWERELREQGDRDGDGPKTSLTDQTTPGAREAG